MKKRKKNNSIVLNKLIMIVILLSFLCAAIKIVYVAVCQNIDGMNLREFADSRNTEEETLYANRGSIYDANGDILAQSVNSYTVIAYLSSSRTEDERYPQHVVDKQKTAAALAPIINMSEEYILERLNCDLYQVELGPGGRNISELTKSEIEALDLSGIDFISGNKRYYKMGDFASYIIGYAQKDDDGKITGKMGIEAYFDEELTGTDGSRIYQKDAYGYKLPNSVELTTEAVSGNDIYLTIDNNIQMFVEKGINSLVNDYDMDWITMSIMDANTGAIVASGSNPSFNLNTLNIDSYLNPLTSYEYEPGSTMKIFSFMAAMENGTYNGDDKYLSGTLQVDDALIKDFNTSGWGTITYDEGFAYSSNVAATKLGLKMGRQVLHDQYEKLGFGEQTGITLPGEQSGDISFTYKTEVATASFGQGITTTPVQNLQALSSLTNDGYTLKPYIVDKIVNSDGEIVYQGQRTELNKVASTETVKKLQSLMYDVVYSGKTDAKYYKAENVTMIGKTGTAQIASPTGGYLTGKYDYIRSFAGIFPYDDPQYILYISVKQFVGPISQVAKTVKLIVEEIAKYKNITDAINTIDESKFIVLDNYLSSDVTATEDKLKVLGLTPIVLGDGKYITNQYPLKNTTALYGTKVFLKTNSNNYVMPDVIGWTSSEIKTYCNLIGLKYKITGYGNVLSTNIPTNTTIDLNTTLEIQLTN